MGLSIIKWMAGFGAKNWLLGVAGVLLVAFAVNAVNARDARIADDALAAVRQVQLDSVSIEVDSLLNELETSEAERLVAIHAAEVSAQSAAEAAERDLAVATELGGRLADMISESAKVVLDSLNEATFAMVLDLTAEIQSKDDLIALLFRKIDIQAVVINAMRTERTLLQQELEFWQNRKDPGSLFDLPVKAAALYGVFKLAEELL